MIITDVQMAGMNGVAFLEEVRRQPELRDVPAIILTAHGGDVVSEGARRLGALVVAKPFDGKVLVTRIGEMAKKSEGA